MHLTHLLHRAVQQQPHRPLTVCEHRERNAPQIAKRVARLAGALRERGVGPGDRVSILAFNSDRYFESLMATWWIGAVVNLVNRHGSVREVTDAVTGVGSAFVLVDEECRLLVTGLDATVTLVYMGDEPAPAGMAGFEDLIVEGPEVEDVRAGGDTLAALIYTGGTTGTPKAVMHSHRSLSTALLGGTGFARSCEIGGITLVMAPLFHIAALLGMMAQTVVGGTVVFANRFDAGDVLGLIAGRRVTTMTAIPSMLQMLYNHPAFSDTDVTSVKSIVYGAAPMPAAILERAMSRFPNANFVQGYGMTETAVIVSLLGSDHRAGGPRLRSAGRASLHAEIIIVDREGNEVPRGTVGEDRHPRRAHHARILESSGGDRRSATRGLAAHRRPRVHGRRGVHLHRRSRQGHDHHRRRERLFGRGGGRRRQPPRCVALRRHRPARRSVGRARACSGGPQPTTACHRRRNSRARQNPNRRVQSTAHGCLRRSTDDHGHR